MMTRKYPTRWDRFKKWLVFGDQEIPTRWDTFKCWFVYGHQWDMTGTSTPASRSMNECRICGKVIAGPD